ncbi:MAG: hypothetical protein WBC63_08825 [Candidatus Bipolaricaulia bacterium]
MRRAGWVVLVLLGLTALAASANVGCWCAPATAPACYTTFKSNEIVEFSLTVPGEYFWIHNTMETPLITGWWVETSEGIVVKQVSLTEPKGHYATFTWDVSADAGGYVEPGFYRIAMTTTSMAPVFADLEIVSCRCSPCWVGCQALCLCRPTSCCTAACGEPYVVLASGGSRNCCWFSLSIYGEFEPPAP